MIKCNAAGRHCHVMNTTLEHPLPRDRGVLLTDDKQIVYRMRLPGMRWVEFIMPFCPWCGARLRQVVRRAREET